MKDYWKTSVVVVAVVVAVGVVAPCLSWPKRVAFVFSLSLSPVVAVFVKAERRACSTRNCWVNCNNFPNQCH